MILIATLNDTFFERSSLDTISIRVDHIAHWKGAFLEWDSFGRVYERDDKLSIKACSWQSACFFIIYLPMCL